MDRAFQADLALAAGGALPGAGGAAHAEDRGGRQG